MLQLQCRSAPEARSAEPEPEQALGAALPLSLALPVPPMATAMAMAMPLQLAAAVPEEALPVADSELARNSPAVELQLFHATCAYSAQLIVRSQRFMPSEHALLGPGVSFWDSADCPAGGLALAAAHVGDEYSFDEEEVIVRARVRLRACKTITGERTKADIRAACGVSDEAYAAMTYRARLSLVDKLQRGWIAPTCPCACCNPEFTDWRHGDAGDGVSFDAAWYTHVSAIGDGIDDMHTDYDHCIDCHTNPCQCGTNELLVDSHSCTQVFVVDPACVDQIVVLNKAGGADGEQFWAMGQSARAAAVDELKDKEAVLLEQVSAAFVDRDIAAAEEAMQQLRDHVGNGVYAARLDAAENWGGLLSRMKSSEAGGKCAALAWLRSLVQLEADANLAELDAEKDLLEGNFSGALGKLQHIYLRTGFKRQTCANSSPFLGLEPDRVRAQIDAAVRRVQAAAASARDATFLEASSAASRSKLQAAKRRLAVALGQNGMVQVEGECYFVHLDADVLSILCARVGENMAELCGALGTAMEICERHLSVDSSADSASHHTGVRQMYSRFACEQVQVLVASGAYAQALHVCVVGMPRDPQRFSKEFLAISNMYADILTERGEISEAMEVCKGAKLWDRLKQLKELDTMELDEGGAVGEGEQEGTGASASGLFDDDY